MMLSKKMWLFLVMISFVMLQTQVAVAQVKSVCYEESFDDVAGNLPDDWVTDEIGRMTDNVVWTLSNDPQYCGDAGNLVGDGDALCVSSHRAAERNNDEAAGIEYNTAIFSPWFTATNATAVTFSLDMNYQSFQSSDELVFVLKSDSDPNDPNTPERSKVIDIYTNDTPVAVEFERASETVEVTITADDPDININDSLRLAWRYSDTGGDISDWYVQIDNIRVVCEEEVAAAAAVVVESVASRLVTGIVESETVTGTAIVQFTPLGVETQPLEINLPINEPFSGISLPIGRYSVTVVSEIDSLVVMPDIITIDDESSQIVNLSIYDVSATQVGLTGVVLYSESRIVLVWTAVLASTTMMMCAGVITSRHVKEQVIKL